MESEPTRSLILPFCNVVNNSGLALLLLIDVGTSTTTGSESDMVFYVFGTA